MGLDNDSDTVAAHVARGRNVVRGDPTDLDFWDRLSGPRDVRLVLLALPNHNANLAAAKEIRKFEKHPGQSFVAATARHGDQADELKANGVDEAFDLHTEAGQGYADFVMNAMSRT